jgi:hypothetical protein
MLLESPIKALESSPNKQTSFVSLETLTFEISTKRLRISLIKPALPVPG